VGRSIGSRNSGFLVPPSHEATGWPQDTRDLDKHGGELGVVQMVKKVRGQDGPERCVPKRELACVGVDRPGPESRGSSVDADNEPTGCEGFQCLPVTSPEVEQGSAVEKARIGGAHPRERHRVILAVTHL
jgi:hypothetical protein